MSLHSIHFPKMLIARSPITFTWLNPMMLSLIFQQLDSRSGTHFTAPSHHIFSCFFPSLLLFLSLCWFLHFSIISNSGFSYSSFSVSVYFLHTSSGDLIQSHDFNSIFMLMIYKFMALVQTSLLWSLIF